MKNKAVNLSLVPRDGSVEEDYIQSYTSRLSWRIDFLELENRGLKKHLQRYMKDNHTLIEHIEKLNDRLLALNMPTQLDLDFG